MIPVVIRPTGDVMNAMTPQGVEHIDDANAVIKIIRVMNAMTPQGVEHVDSHPDLSGIATVMNPMTPQGVEHLRFRRGTTQMVMR